MEIVRIGLDLAKSVFEVCGVDIRDHVVLRKTLRREAVPQFFAELPPCLIGMEACSSSHYWAKMLTDLGHQVRLIAPQFVTPYLLRKLAINRSCNAGDVHDCDDRHQRGRLYLIDDIVVISRLGDLHRTRQHDQAQPQEPGQAKRAACFDLALLRYFERPQYRALAALRSSQIN